MQQGSITRRKPAKPVSRRSFMMLAVSGFAMVSVVARRGVAGAAPAAPILPGVPASVGVEAWLTLELEGDYRWQSTKFAATAEASGPIQVHHGFLVATDKAVEVSDPAFGIHVVPAGGALAVGEQQQLMLKATAGDARIMFVELVAPDTGFEGEQPDSVKEFTVAKGRYTAAVLAIPGGANAPKPAQVVAKAAAPAIAVTPEGASATDATAMWLVALFPVA